MEKQPPERPLGWVWSRIDVACFQRMRFADWLQSLLNASEWPQNDLRLPAYCVEKGERDWE
jgi:hypothetical protein